MNGKSYVTALNINGVLYLSVTGSPNGVVSAPRGSVATDKATGNLYTNTDGAMTWVQVGGGSGSGIRETVILRPAGPADPVNGVYTLFSDAHAALAALGTGGVIQIDSPGVATVLDDAGSPYDMKNIVLQGNLELQNFELDNQIEIPEGVVFTNFEGNWQNLTVTWQGTATPLYVVDGFSAQWRSGWRSVWQTALAATIEALRGINGAGFEITLDEFSTISGMIDGQRYELISVDGTSACSLYQLTSSQILADTIRGAGTALDVLLAGNLSYDTQQTNLAGGVMGTLVGPYPYIPAAPGDWGGDPLNLDEATNRIAAAVAGLLGGPIP